VWLYHRFPLSSWKNDQNRHGCRATTFRHILLSSLTWRDRNLTPAALGTPYRPNVIALTPQRDWRGP
jgi:hypothetical protein